MKSKASIFIFLFCWFVSLLSWGQNFQKISNKEGFNQNTVVEIVQDQHGFLWFATPNGLISFDGQQFTTHTGGPNQSNTISDNNISSLFVDRKGLVWIGNRTGLDIYIPSKERFVKIPIPEKNDINHISNDESNKIWINTGNGIKLVERLSNKDYQFEVADFVSFDFKDDSTINSFHFSKEKLLLATTNGLFETTVDYSNNKYTKNDYEGYKTSEVKRVKLEINNILNEQKRIRQNIAARKEFIRKKELKIKDNRRKIIFFRDSVINEIVDFSKFYLENLNKIISFDNSQLELNVLNELNTEIIKIDSILTSFPSDDNYPLPGYGFGLDYSPHLGFDGIVDFKKKSKYYSDWRTYIPFKEGKCFQCPPNDDFYVEDHKSFFEDNELFQDYNNKGYVSRSCVDLGNDFKHSTCSNFYSYEQIGTEFQEYSPEYFRIKLNCEGEIFMDKKFRELLSQDHYPLNYIGVNYNWQNYDSWGLTRINLLPEKINGDLKYAYDPVFSISLMTLKFINDFLPELKSDLLNILDFHHIVHKNFWIATLPRFEFKFGLDDYYENYEKIKNYNEEDTPFSYAGKYKDDPRYMISMDYRSFQTELKKSSERRIKKRNGNTFVFDGFPDLLDPLLKTTNDLLWLHDDDPYKFDMRKSLGRFSASKFDFLNNMNTEKRIFSSLIDQLFEYDYIDDNMVLTNKYHETINRISKSTNKIRKIKEFLIWFENYKRHLIPVYFTFGNLVKNKKLKRFNENLVKKFDKKEIDFLKEILGNNSVLEARPYFIFTSEGKPEALLTHNGNLFKDIDYLSRIRNNYQSYNFRSSNIYDDEGVRDFVKIKRNDFKSFVKSSINSEIFEAIDINKLHSLLEK